MIILILLLLPAIIFLGSTVLAIPTVLVFNGYAKIKNIDIPEIKHTICFKFKRWEGIAIILFLVSIFIISLLMI